MQLSEGSSSSFSVCVQLPVHFEPSVCNCLKKVPLHFQSVCNCLKEVPLLFLVCAQLHRPQGAFLTCTEEQSPYLMTCNVTCLPGYLSPTSFPLYTCGEESGYVWNHQRDQQLLPDLPSCTRECLLLLLLLYFIISCWKFGPPYLGKAQQPQQQARYPFSSVC